MAFKAERKFSFESKAIPKDAFKVIQFSGDEGLNRPYRFEIDLMSDKKDIDLDQILEKPAVLTIHRESGDLPFNGILASFEMAQAFQDFVFYRAVLVPRFWRLSLTFHNQVFLDMNLPDIITAVLKDGGLTENDFDLRLEKEYPPWEYVCQYRESHLDFVSRWMERDGLYYWFEQDSDQEKLVISDTSIAHVTMPGEHEAVYSPPSGLEMDHFEEIVQTFICRQRPMPKQVHVKDYNYRRPELHMSGRAPVSNKGIGDVYLYGDHVRSPEEGKRLAQIRAEELLCRQREFHGESQIPFLRPGYTFDLKQHYRKDYNQSYLTVRLEHRGSQVSYLTAGLGSELTGFENSQFYGNGFTAIEASRQFRPFRQTEKARIYGTMNAFIDASGSGHYAELDEIGRYKVTLPFDRSGRKGGKASAFLRMMQPYGGEDHGMHFPLHRGTEVLLSFMDGDPDRPIISGAVPNPDHPSPVTDENQTMAVITSSSDNKIHMEDKEGSQRILMHSPTADSYARIGATNDPELKWTEKPKIETMEHEKDGITFATSQFFEVKAATTNKVTLGECIKLVGILEGVMIIGEKFDLTLGHRLNMSLSLITEFNAGWHWYAENSVIEMNWFKKKVEGEKLSIRAAQELIREQLEELEGDATQAVVNADVAVEGLNEAAGNANTTKGNLERITGEADELKGTVDHVTGIAKTLKGELNKATGSANKIRGQLTRLHGEATEVRNTMTAAAGTIDSVAAEVTRIHSSDITI